MMVLNVCILAQSNKMINKGTSALTWPRTFTWTWFDRVPPTPTPMGRHRVPSVWMSAEAALQTWFVRIPPSPTRLGLHWVPYIYFSAEAALQTWFDRIPPVPTPAGLRRGPSVCLSVGAARQTWFVRIPPAGLLVAHLCSAAARSWLQHTVTPDHLVLL